MALTTKKAFEVYDVLQGNNDYYILVARLMVGLNENDISAFVNHQIEYNGSIYIIDTINVSRTFLGQIIGEPDTSNVYLVCKKQFTKASAPEKKPYIYDEEMKRLDATFDFLAGIRKVFDKHLEELEQEWTEKVKLFINWRKTELQQAFNKLCSDSVSKTLWRFTFIQRHHFIEGDKMNHQPDEVEVHDRVLKRLVRSEEFEPLKKYADNALKNLYYR